MMAPNTQVTRKRQPSGAMVLARPAPNAPGVPRLVFGSGVTLAPLRLVAARTPWDTQAICFGAPGSASGNVMAELCSGAFATMTQAATAAGLSPRQAWDKDATRTGNAKLASSAPECIFHAWDLTDTTRWRYLSNTDVWGIGIPCQSTSGAGRSGGRHDDRDLFATLMDLLRYVRPPPPWRRWKSSRAFGTPARRTFRPSSVNCSHYRT